MKAKHIKNNSRLNNFNSNSSIIIYNRRVEICFTGSPGTYASWKNDRKRLT